MLISNIGTFYSKYYPYKNIVGNILEAYELVQDQFNQTLSEINDKASLKDCPLYKTYLWYKIVASELPGSGIVSVDRLQDKIINPNLQLTNHIDFTISEDGVLTISDPSNVRNYYWGVNAKFESDYLHNAWSFIFFKESDENIRRLTEILLYVYRFGLSENNLIKFFNIFFGYPYIIDNQETILEILPGTVITNTRTYEDIENEILLKKGITYDRNTPISAAVSIEDIYEQRQMLWDHFRWDGGGKWDVKDYLKRSGVKLSVGYKPTYSLKHLDYIEKAKPVWLGLDIEISKTVYDGYQVDSDSATIDKGKYVQEVYNTIRDGSVSRGKWGQIYWDQFKWGMEEYQNDVQVIRQYM